MVVGPGSEQVHSEPEGSYVHLNSQRVQAARLDYGISARETIKG